VVCAPVLLQTFERLTVPSRVHERLTALGELELLPLQVLPRGLVGTLGALEVGLPRKHVGRAAGHARRVDLSRACAGEPGGGSFDLVLAVAMTHHRAGKLLLAAGNGNARLGPMVGLDVPVRPQRGHIIVTEKVAPFLDHPIVTVRQTDEGGVMIGDSVEEAGWDVTVGAGVVSAMAERAVRMFPQLGRLNVVRTWAALRVMTPDGFPIYRQSVSCPGAFVATCHSGVTLAANHALVLAPLIATGDLPAEQFGVFGARRFDVPATA